MVGCVVGLLFENYIVNASIFIRSNFLENELNLERGAAGFCLSFGGVGAGGVSFHGSLDKVFFDLFVVVKFLRAHGGCLGIRSRRRT